MIEIEYQLPTAIEYCQLRQRAGLSAKSVAAAEKGLPHTLFIIGLRVKSNQQLIGMGRVVGDGACFFQIVDIMVDPDYQGMGLGKLVMEHIDRWLDSQALTGSYVSMIADKPEFYEKLGYKLTYPEAQGMYRRLIPAQPVDNIQLIGYQTKHTSQLSSVEKEQIYQLLFQVFKQGFSREDFDHTLGGMHILAYDNHQLIGHVAIVQRSVIVDCSPFRIGYLEGLGVAEAYRRQGIGRKLMEQSSEIIVNSHDFGLLSASEEGLPLYQSLGWKIWTGELYESNRESYQRSFDDEGSVLFWAAPSQSIAATSPLYCDYRSGDQW